MKIWVDADACPKPIKEIVYRAACRSKTLATFVSNQPLRLPASPFLKTKQVALGFDMADKAIVDEVEAGDLVITADIPLAADVVKKGAVALNPRGKLYTKESVQQSLALRDLNEVLREAYVLKGGPPALTRKEIHAFSKHLDPLIAAQKR